MSSPRWYSHLYPAVDTRRNETKWPLIGGEMGKLLAELKWKLDKAEVPRSSATTVYKEYRKQVQSLTYIPTPAELKWREDYDRSFPHGGGPGRDYDQKLWEKTRAAGLENAKMEFYNSVVCETFKPGYFVVHREWPDKDHPDSVTDFTYPMYGYFDTVAQFRQWLDAQPASHRMFHEQVFADRPQKIFFDIDAPQLMIAEAASRTDCILHDAADPRKVLFDTFVSVVKSEFKSTYNLELKDENLVICDSSNDKKFSRHVLIVGFHEANFRERSFFSLRVHTALISKDLRVGGSLDRQPLITPSAALRILGCHKWGQPERAKKLLSEHSFSDSIIQDIATASVLLPTLAPPPSALSGRCVSGMVCDKVAAAVEKAFPGLYGVDHGSRYGNLFIYPANYQFLCPFCGVKHDNVASHGLMVSLSGKVMKAFCSRYDAHPDTRRAMKFETIGDLKGYPTWYLEAAEAYEASGRVGSRTPTHMPNVEHVNEEELSLDLCVNALAKCDTLIVRSPMGTAKTKAMIAYCEKVKPESVLILGSRVAYDEGLALRYSNTDVKFTNYLDIPTQSILLDDHRHLVVQIESLHRLIFRQGPAGIIWPELLILDEIEGLIQQFSHETMMATGTIHRCWAVFEALVKYSKKVVMMDAFVGKRTLDLAKRMRDEKTTKSIVNTYASASDRRYIIVPDKKQVAMIHGCVTSGVPIVVCSNSKAYAKDIEQSIRTLVKERGLPEKKIAMYTGETGGEARKGLADLAKAWADLDVLIYTPTITIGCSFELEHFKFVFGFFTAHSCGYRDCIQMLGRVRDVYNPDTETHTYCIAFPDNYAVYDESMTVEWLEGCLENTYRRALANSGHDAHTASNLLMASKLLDSVPSHIDGTTGKLVLVKDNYYYMQMGNAIEAIRSRNNFVYEFLSYLADSGAELSLEGCDCIPAVAADRLESLKKSLDTVAKQQEYEALRRQISEDADRDETAMKAAGIALKEAKVQVQHDDSVRIGDAVPFSVQQVAAVKSSVRGQMGQSVLDSMEKATLAAAYGIESKEVDREFVVKYGSEKTRTIFKRLRESTCGESISASIAAVRRKCGSIVVDKMSKRESTHQLDCKDRSIRHELCESLMKLMGFDLSKARRWEELPTPDYDSAVTGLRKGLPAYIDKYKTALIHELGKKSSTLHKPEEWEEKRVKEFARRMLQATYGVNVHLVESSKWVAVGLDANWAPFRWNPESQRYEVRKPDR
jgi:hypothetical protein